MLELDGIALLPTELNSGNSVQGNFNFAVDDVEPSLPIFTSPMEAVVGSSNWKIWPNNGIKPVIPRTESIEFRLEACGYIFVAFSKEEVKQHFIVNINKSPTPLIRICIDAGNGHDTEVLEIGKNLRRIYGPRVSIMGGNIGNPSTYLDYCRADFDYVRVGLSSGSLVDYEKYGFYYPMASLLIDINTTKKTTGVGLKQTKIIADGGIKSPSDILKCIALGADYVMIGREFAKLLEANGDIYKEVYDTNEKKRVLEPQNKEDLVNMDVDSLKRLELVRIYKGNTTNQTQAERAGYSSVEKWESTVKKKKPVDSRCENVVINSNLETWLKGMYECFNYGFVMTSSIDWKSFKNNVKYIHL